MCVSPARLFVNRMLSSLRAAGDKHVELDSDFHRDLAWFRTSLEPFNGVVVFRESQPVSHHKYVDSLPLGAYWIPRLIISLYQIISNRKTSHS